MITTTEPNSTATFVGSRSIAYRTRGLRHGPIVRLVSPSDLGEMIKPFVFLDHFNVEGESAPAFGFHPHSGIATMSVLFEGAFEYEDSTGAKGIMEAGSVEWMQAGNGVWHTGKALGQRINGYQLWIALPPGLENAPPLSKYVDPAEFSKRGPARIILGEFEGAVSPIRAPMSINVLDVRLKADQVWNYTPPSGHEVAWIAVHRGNALTPEAVHTGEFVVFEESEKPIAITARGDTSFLIGSAAKHPHDLVLGRYSVHTDSDALKSGEQNIRQIADELRRQGKL